MWSRRERPGDEADGGVVTPYLVAVVSVGAAVLARWLLDPWLGGHAPLTTVYGAVAVSVYVGGYRPALLAAALGFAACSRLFVEPRGSAWPVGVGQWIAFGAYLFSCGLIVGFGEAFHAARRRLAEERARLLASEERLAAILDQLPVGVSVMDVEGRVTLSNAIMRRFVPERLPSLDPDRRGRWRAWGPDGAPLPPDEWPGRRAMRGESVVPGVEFLFADDDGREVWTNVATTPLRDAGGAVVGAVVVVQDDDQRKRAEEGLRESEARFRQLADAMPQIVYVTGPDGRVEFVNRQWHDYTGRADAQTDDLGPLVHPDDLPAMMRRWEEASTTGAPFVAEFRLRRAADGEYRWFLTRSVPVRDGEGRVVRWYGTSTDIHDMKRQEAEREAIRGTFSTLIERCPFGIYIVDDEFRIANMNAGSQAGAFANVRPVIGRPLDEAMRILWPGPVAEVVTGNFRHTLETGEPYYSRDFVNPRADIDQTEGYEWELHRITLPSGRHGVVCYYYDSTRLRQVELQLRKRTGQLDFTLDATGVGMWLNTMPLGKLNWDRRTRELFHVPPGEEPPIELFWGRLHPDDREPTRLAVEAALRDHALYEIEHRVVHPTTGEVRWVRSMGQASYDGAGAPVRFDGINYDVTARKGLEDELRRVAAELSEADRRKDEFLATLAHELRNPLAPLRNGLQIMKLAGGNAEAVEKSRSMMERQVGQMAHLIDDLMDLSRISLGKIVLQKARLRVADVVQDAVETARPLIEERGHELVVDVPPGPIYVDADRTRLAQVFGNLLNNAAKYTEKGGRIRVGVGREDGDVVVSVEDDGVGIPAHLLTRVFDMFAQIEGSLEKSQGGLGIGLNIVKRLVAMHDGGIVAESGGHGAGSRFVVRLPVALTVASAEPDGYASVQAARPARRRILVVDDNRDGATSQAEMLTMLGNDARTAFDGAEAVAVAEAFRPGVILMDIGMPRLNGYEACRRIREQPWGRDVVIVAQTGWGQEDDQRKSREAGFDFHMVKPIDPAALERMLAELKATTG